MSETVSYIDSTGGTTVLSASPGRYIGGNVDTWNVTPVFDVMIGDVDNFGGYAVDHAEWELRFALGGTSYANARSALAAWRKVFMNDASRGSAGSVVIVHDGGTYTIDAAGATPDITGPDGNYIGATLKFHSRSPFWRHNAPVGTTSAFGTAAVAVTWSNTGDYKTWPTYSITGAMGTPKWEDKATGDYVQIGTAWGGAADQVWVWTDVPLIRYYAGGTGAGTRTAGTNWTKYAGTASTFYPLQVGAGTVELTAASGSAAFTASYDIRKAGLG